MKCTGEKYASIINAGRPVSDRQRMDIGHRAKQFAPFSALKGLEDSVKEKEIVYTDQCILPDEKRDELDRIVRDSDNGKEYEVVYYKKKDRNAEEGRYIKAYGRIQYSESNGYIRVGEKELKNSDIKDIVEIANVNDQYYNIS